MCRALAACMPVTDISIWTSLTCNTTHNLSSLDLPRCPHTNCQLLNVFESKCTCIYLPTQLSDWSLSLASPLVPSSTAAPASCESSQPCRASWRCCWKATRNRRPSARPTSARRTGFDGAQWLAQSGYYSRSRVIFTVSACVRLVPFPFGRPATRWRTDGEKMARTPPW